MKGKSSQDNLNQIQCTF